ncbi:MAG: isoleucine--tRNA ligase [Candidatus Eisenbacteria bacterium]|nr:isoleucine--tRNA ligase [Candidatus Eisenbacteria bacterium]
MRFQEIAKSLTPGKQDEIIGFWKEKKIFEKCLETRKNSPRFVFYEGPPTANGLPGVHHVMARTVKDIVCRYKTMTGHYVLRKAGWDTHGLPVEIEVEQELNLNGKDEIEKYGIARFNAKCKESVFRYEKEWKRLTERIGFWLDLESPYITCTNEYIETVWWILKKFWDAGLIKKGYKILPYCPRCGTPLSSHEVSQGYREVSDPSVYVKFPLGGGSREFLLAWTTTPWTLISNVALAVHPSLMYVRAGRGGESLILAKDRLSVLGDDWKVEAEFSGEKLVKDHPAYEPIFHFFKGTQGGFRTVTADFVSAEEGTGIVHIAPAFGEDDFNLGNEKGLPLLQPVDGSGKFTPPVSQWAGIFVKDADPGILEDLSSRNLVFRKEAVLHSYPYCWRCETPLIYYARSSWNVRTTSYRDKMVEANSAVQWRPREVGEHRFANWIAGNVDWALSRDRYWGTPLNIWICDSCSKETSVGSIAELSKMAVSMPEKLDLHRPYVDEIELNCPSCSGKMKRTAEVIDCWFDSGSMPYGQWHYPFENQDMFEENFPADFIAEGMDQSRGWFYSLLAISTFVSGKACFKNVIPVEMILDSSGQRMSKSKGTAVDPDEILDSDGADSLRWYLVSSSPLWVPTRFEREGVKEVSRKLFATLRNVSQFFVLYANIDGYWPGTWPVGKNALTLSDRWILSRMNSLIKKVARDLDDYELTRAARNIQDFVVDELSNWYVRRNRRRFWKPGSGEDKSAAYFTLHEVLSRLVRLMAPIAPFISEEIFQSILAPVLGSGNESVHLCDFPECDEGMIDKELEEKMAVILKIVTLSRAARNRAGLKTRQPLSSICVAGVDTVDGAIKLLSDHIKEEINVKEVKYSKDRAEIVTTRLKADFSKLGPRLGKDVGLVEGKLGSLSPEEIGKLKAGEPVEIAFPQKRIQLMKDDVEIIEEGKEDSIVEVDGDTVVSLDLRVTDELIAEGIARELVHRIQSLRKNAGLEVTDRIRLSISCPGKTRKAIGLFGEYIKGEVLADELKCEETARGTVRESWKIEDECVEVGLAEAS